MYKFILKYSWNICYLQGKLLKLIKRLLYFGKLKLLLNTYDLLIVHRLYKNAIDKPKLQWYFKPYSLKRK